MLNLHEMLKAPEKRKQMMPKFEIQMKPTGMSKSRSRPEYMITIEADDKELAVSEARRIAAIEGFNGYAITKIKEIENERT